jgi:altronate hydrolase
MAEQMHIIDERDTVAVLLEPVCAGAPISLSGIGLVASDNMDAGHKIALKDMARGDDVIKYGFVIGEATARIQAGDHVHEHNLASALSVDDLYKEMPAGQVAAPRALLDDSFEFQGYVRADGRVGTRNEIWILPTVGCVNATAAQVATIASQQFGGKVDGIHSFAHQFGCSQLGDDLANTADLIAGLARNPNAGGVLILGLGCENNQMAGLQERLEGYDAARLKFLAVQDVDDEFEAALDLVAELVEAAAEDKRTPIGLEGLVLGLKCGGSDAYSGLTANPLLGMAADQVCGAGGSSLLTEIPEMFGAEPLLLSRAANSQVREALINEFKAFRGELAHFGHAVSSNPSPGNKRGGITTLEEKSLGAVQKGGANIVVDVLPYGAPCQQAGLSVISAPGNDAVSSTALAAAGANLILFTTGRGTPLGFPVPTVKVASNSDLSGRKSHWIDYDAGSLLGSADKAEETRKFLDALCAYASGEQTANERLGAREIAIWKKGVTL